MSGIRGRDTKPEHIVRSYLHKAGLRFRLHANLPGKPDLVFPKHRTVVFVHGCFWHRHAGCKYAAVPKTNAPFWREKFNENVARDQRVQEVLEQNEWRVIVIWECQISKRALNFLRCEIAEKRKGRH